MSNKIDFFKMNKAELENYLAMYKEVGIEPGEKLSNNQERAEFLTNVSDENGVPHRVTEEDTNKEEFSEFEAGDIVFIDQESDDEEEEEKQEEVEEQEENTNDQPEENKAQEETKETEEEEEEEPRKVYMGKTIIKEGNVIVNGRRYIEIETIDATKHVLSAEEYENEVKNS